MTPLAQRIVKELTVPANQRTFVDRCGMLGQMQDVHCFEVTEVYEAATELLAAGTPYSEGMRQVPVDRMEGVAAMTSFLPAPKTWIEFEGGPGTRMGFLLEEVDGFAIVQLAIKGPSLFASDNLSFAFGLGAKGVDPGLFSASRDLSFQEDRLLAANVGVLNALLAFINTPRIVDRKEHAAHRGLQRTIASALGAKYGFQLHPWTEIKLHVTPPAGSEGEGEPGVALTGQRALHFCRSHLRLRNGRLEIVRAHMRGNAAAGVKQTRYRVEA